MTSEEAIAAFKGKLPVIDRGGGNEIEYLCISALIYRLDSDNKMRLSVELLDKSEHSVTISTPSRCRLKE